jgi:hypothetical protein
MLATVSKISWSYTQSCCGNKGAVATLPKAIKKSGIQVFRDAGWLVPDNFLNSGIFYVKKNNLIATSAYGATQTHVRCTGDQCPNLMTEFEGLILKAIA